MSRLKKGSILAALIVASVGGFEGVSQYAYRDPVGIPTICFGETRGVKMGDYKSLAECKDMLSSRVIEFSVGVEKCLIAPERVPDKMFAAQVSLAYNIGVGAFCGSTLVKKTNAGDLRGACDEFPRWNRAGGVVLPGLTKRRAVERDMCLAGVADRKVTL